jgi:hypothetical protein
MKTTAISVLAASALALTASCGNAAPAPKGDLNYASMKDIRNIHPNMYL